MENKTIKIEEVIASKGVYVGPTVGMSMFPMLKNRRDTIVVKAKTERLKPLDVALYKRGNMYVMHRVIAVLEDGYHIRGDNCYYDEKVAEEVVFGVLTEFFRKNKHYDCTDAKYLRYAKKRVKRYEARKKLQYLKTKCRNAFVKCIQIFKRKK